MSKDDLTSDDLFLLMKSYENTVTLNTTILQELEVYEKALEKINNVSTDIKEKIRNFNDANERNIHNTCELHSLSKAEFNEIKIKLNEIISILHNKLDNLEKLINNNAITLEKKISQVSQEVTNTANTIKTNLVVIQYGIVSVILGLIGIVITVLRS